MEKEKIIQGLETLRDDGEVVSQTLILDEAIKLLQTTPVIKIFYNDGGVLDCSSINIFGNEVVADEVYTIKDYEIDHIEAGEV